MRKLLIALGLVGLSFAFIVVMDTTAGGPFRQVLFDAINNAITNYINSSNNLKDTGITAVDELNKLLWNGQDNITNIDKYSKIYHQQDDTAGLLGYFLLKNGMKNPQEIENQLRRLSDALAKQFDDLSDPTRQDIDQSYLNTLLATQLQSAISYGTHIKPDTNQYNAYDPILRTKYSYTVYMQNLRQAVIKSHLQRIAKARNRLQALWKESVKYCQINPLGGDKSPEGYPYERMDQEIPDVPDIIAGSCDGKLSYTNIITRLDLLNSNLLHITNRTQRIMCLNLFTELYKTLTELQRAEIELLTLATNFAILSNMEKDRLLR